MEGILETIWSSVEVKLAWWEKTVWRWGGGGGVLLELLRLLLSWKSIVVVGERILWGLLAWVVLGVEVVVVLVWSLVQVWTVLTILIVVSLVVGSLLLGDGIVLRLWSILWSWGLWNGSFWKMITRNLESVLSSGVLNSDGLAVISNVAVLTTTVTLGVSLFLELGAILLVVSRSETSITRKVTSLLENSSLLRINVTLSCNCGDEGEESLDKLKDKTK